MKEKTYYISESDGDISVELHEEVSLDSDYEYVHEDFQEGIVLLHYVEKHCQVSLEHIINFSSEINHDIQASTKASKN
jgi:hypothetical protein